MRCVKYMKLKFLHRNELLVLVSVLALLSYVITKLPVCNNHDNEDEILNPRRSSRLDFNNANVDDEEDEDTDDDKLGAGDVELSKISNDVRLKAQRGITTEKWKAKRVSNVHPYEEIDCLINGDFTIPGRRDENETYIPFSFLEKYFEIDGKLMKSPDGRGELERFEWHHSTARVYNQKPYTCDGTFMTFDHYHVEQRTKVKYISGVEGVPVSIQWDPKGYFYAIQISQFGLTHYTKNLTDPTPVIITYEDADDEDALRKWRRGTASDAKNNIKIVYDEEKASKVVEFKTSEYSLTSKGFTLPMESQTEFVLSFDAMFFSNFSIIISVEAENSNREIKLIYSNREDSIEKKGQVILHGLGPVSKWRHITRNLVADYRKGITINRKESAKKTKETISRVKSLSVIGNGRMDNISLWSYNHMAHFIDAANWLLSNQDEKGGWPVDVGRKLDDDMVPIPPGWYSAMAQGQAMSTLTRAYRYTKDYKYLQAALSATELFKIPSSKGGIRATFVDTYHWYEEYPTTPSSFVLNGFIFSLIGLFDLKCAAGAEEGREAARLYDDGINSLKNMLPLYDTGTGSTYDLRHFTLQKEPNLARWGYHATHIAQLQLLSSINSDPIFKSTLDRWVGYTKGIKGKSQKNKGFTHNKEVMGERVKGHNDDVNVGIKAVGSSPLDVRVLELRMSAP